MSSQAFSLAVWESLFPACVVRGRANLLLSFHSAAPIPLQSLSVFSLLLAVAGQQEEAPSLFHISSPLKYPLDVVLPFSYIRGRFVYCPFLLVQFKMLPAFLLLTLKFPHRTGSEEHTDEHYCYRQSQHHSGHKILKICAAGQLRKGIHRDPHDNQQQARK